MLSENAHVREGGEMRYFRAGSQAARLVTLLSFTGEFPFSSLSVMGNERVLKALVRRLASEQTVRDPETGKAFTGRILTVSGRGKEKSVRLYKSALVLLGWVHPDAPGFYMEAFWGHRFPGDAAHRERNHRVAEAAALCMRAGIEARPYLLPKLQNKRILRAIPDSPCMYLARDLKKIGETEMNKTMFTRMTGAVFSPGGCYAVYNTRNAVMKWGGMGEFKALVSLTEAARLNAGTDRVDGAVLVGRSGGVALRTLLESDKSHRLELRFDSIYHHIYFVPMDPDGIRQLALLCLADWKGRLLSLLFEAGTRSYDRGMFEYDACVDGVYVLSHLDGDIARLVRFKEAAGGGGGPFEVLCFPHQAGYVRAYLGRLAGVRMIGMDLVYGGLGLTGRDLFEG